MYLNRTFPTNCGIAKKNVKPGHEMYLNTVPIYSHHESSLSVKPGHEMYLNSRHQ